MAAFSDTKLAGSSWLQRRLPQETKYVLPESIAETRSLLHLLDGVAHTHWHSPTPRFLQPSAEYFRCSVNSGGRVLQSNSVCAALLLADTNEDYIAQVAPCSITCLPPSRRVPLPRCAGHRLRRHVHWQLGHARRRHGCSHEFRKDGLEEEAGGKFTVIAAACSRCRAPQQHHTVTKSHCFEVHERLRMMPDALAAVINGCVKAVARARQCRWLHGACVPVCAVVVLIANLPFSSSCCLKIDDMGV